VRYSLHLPEGTKVIAPDVREWVRDFEVLEQSAGITRKIQRKYRTEFEGAAFDTGFVRIPAMPLILYRESGDEAADTLYTPEKFLYIYSVLDSTASALPLQTPVPLMLLRWWEILITLLLLSTAGLLLYFGLRSRNGTQKMPMEFWLPPREKAERALDSLLKKHYPENAEWKAFYLELTYIIREYYEAVFFVHLQEMTTSGLLHELETRVGTALLPELRDFLNFADLVKFAKVQASKVRCDLDLQRVRDLIAESDERLNPGMTETEENARNGEADEERK
ncbi:MAG: hypothetical protein WC210_00975, partial [Candidatus Neomarinimicrobiota bacterium]